MLVAVWELPMLVIYIPLMRMATEQLILKTPKISLGVIITVLNLNLVHLLHLLLPQFVPVLGQISIIMALLL